MLALFAIYAVSTPFLREPTAPVVHVTIEPQPLPQTTEPRDETSDATSPAPQETTSPGYRTGERTGEQLNHLWQQTKGFGRGLWAALTEKEN